MSSAAVQSMAELADFLGKHPDAAIALGVADIDGVVRGRLVGREKLLSGIETGLSICDCVLGWDVDDALYEVPGGRSAAVGWHFGFPDAPLRIVGDSLRLIDDAGGRSSIWAMCEFGGRYEPICPRSVLRRIVSRAGEIGFSVKCGFEYEFTLFREDSRSLRDKGFRNLRTLTEGNFGYSVLKINEYDDLFRELRQAAERFRLPVEALHTENGPGLWEIALSPSEPLRAADNAALLKIAVKQAAAKRDLTACFMAKISEAHQGQGGHMHLSLLDGEQQPCFLAEEHPHTPTRTLRQFIGGQQSLMPELAAMAAPNINSYRRLVPGTWAPTVANWGIDNRTCALRVLLNSPSSARVEYRLAGADANPYLALAAALGSGLHGIENHLEPEEAVVGNAYEQPHDERLRIPADLGAAADRLHDSTASRSLFGDAFIDHFVMSRRWECAQFAKSVTDWELARYAEII